MSNVRMVSPVSVSVCRLRRRPERFSNGAINAQHRLHGVIRSLPTGPISACVSVHMGLLRTHSQARKPGLNFD
jgi:hypothetical protein